MRHTRAEVVERTRAEFERLDRLVADLSAALWARPLARPETKDPWTVKDSLAHITHWKADQARRLRRQRPPAEERGLDTNAGNHLVYERWRDRSPAEVLGWHRAVQADVLAALAEAPDAFFTGRERGPQWPYDLDAHSVWHRTRDIERALKD
ncbi:MAG TPA: maleylpyruvate isomerase N-terminal domain-containing protein [Candidatus Limnocylindrales bacterium]|nr:maleylpyruvate isomerase N-terminal domain-containing protein [Candidatus Limnocylindrales bacterium]